MMVNYGPTAVEDAGAVGDHVGDMDEQGYPVDEAAYEDYADEYAGEEDAAGGETDAYADDADYYEAAPPAQTQAQAQPQTPPQQGLPARKAYAHEGRKGGSAGAFDGGVGEASAAEARLRSGLYHHDERYHSPPPAPSSAPQPRSRYGLRGGQLMGDHAPASASAHPHGHTHHAMRPQTPTEAYECMADDLELSRPSSRRGDIKSHLAKRNAELEAVKLEVRQKADALMRDLEQAGVHMGSGASKAPWPHDATYDPYAPTPPARSQHRSQRYSLTPRHSPTPPSASPPSPPPPPQPLSPRLSPLPAAQTPPRPATAGGRARPVSAAASGRGLAEAAVGSASANSSSRRNVYLKYSFVPGWVLVARRHERFFRQVLDYYFNHNAWPDYHKLPEGFRSVCAGHGVGPNHAKKMPGFAPIWLFVLKKMDKRYFLAAVDHFFDCKELPSWDWLPEPFTRKFHELGISERHYYA